MHYSRMCTAEAVAIQGGGPASVHAGIHTPQVWAWRPPRCGPGDPPGCGPGDPPPQVCPWRPPSPRVWTWRPSSPGVDLETLPPPGCGPGDPLARPLNFPSGCWPGDPPWRPARHVVIPPARHAGIPTPPVNRMTDTCKNITFANFVCGR